MKKSSSPLLTVSDLTVAFPTEEGPAFAVNRLSFSVDTKQVLGLVGESGCGKSMTSLAILRLIPKPGYIDSGDIVFDGTHLRMLDSDAMRRIRGSDIALIPQDPMTSLNPVYTIREQLAEVLMLHQGMSERAALQRGIELLDLVRLPNAKERIHEYPHQFSGGMRQRVMIAMALSCNPKLLIADEPTTALDVTVQAQILTLMRDIQQEFETAIILITHDLGVVAEMCDDVAVMYAGRIVEKASVSTLFKNPHHPYTQGLIASLPRDGMERLHPIDGQPPLLTKIPVGCSFEPRCPKRMDECTVVFPDISTPQDDHQVRCFLY